MFFGLLFLFSCFYFLFLFCFDRSFAVLFRNAQLPLMRSKPSTPELYKFHSILLGRFRFVNKREAGAELGKTNGTQNFMRFLFEKY